MYTITHYIAHKMLIYSLIWHVCTQEGSMEESINGLVTLCGNDTDETVMRRTRDELGPEGT